MKYFSGLVGLLLTVNSVFGQNLLESINGDSSLKTFSTLLNDPNYVSLKEVLTGSNEFTVFAPTDAAFTNAKIDMTQPKTVLAYLQYLTVYGNFDSSTLDIKRFPFTLLKDSAYVNQDGDVQVLIFDKNSTHTFIAQGLNSSNVIKLDAHKATNGVVHIVDALLPPPNTPYQVLRDAGYQELADAAERAALVNTMNDVYRLTIFTPTNEALVQNDFASKTRPQLSPIVKNQVINDIVLSNKLQDGAKFQSTMGYSLNIKSTNGSLFVNGCRILRTDILTYNGVMHIIDGVIALPPNHTSDSPSQSLLSVWSGLLSMAVVISLKW
ncbi:hypothetical protein K7432_006460 [Basidiobolus ranarum]|uniref:FAS1 domain-containing protein n=1 Tax=Basidiobolus ranarum TaxID=34480 RepID=A0ABR2W206_9FUNG